MAAEVRYDSKLCPHGVVTILQGARDQRLEVKFGPAAGSVVATVTDGSDPARGAGVVLVPDDVDDDEVLCRVMRRGTADKDGRAVIADLLPGTYRLVAYPEGVLWGDDPKFKQRLAGGHEVRISGKQQVLVQLRTQ